MNKFYLLFIFLISTAISSFAQSVGIGTDTPDPSAQLEINSSTKGLLIPWVSLTATNSPSPVTSPANSLLVYNNAGAGAGAFAVTPGFYRWDKNAASWVRFLTTEESLWYSMGTNAPATNFTDDIYRFQRVAIGGPGNATYNARLHVDIGDTYQLGFLVTGDTSGLATTPDIGAGSRMYYYPGKSAFRSGFVNGTQWNNINTGRYSSAMGYNTTASGLYATSIGSGSTASGTGSVAIGFQDSALNSYATALGQLTRASGIASFAAGSTDTASGDYSTAIGYKNKASGLYSIAMGSNNTATSTNAVAIGSGAYTAPFSSTAFSKTNATGFYSMALAGGTANDENAFAVGYNAVASNNNAVALGFFSVASGGGAFAGPVSTADGSSSLALNGGHSYGSNANAIGSSTMAHGISSTALGSSDTATGNASIAAGQGVYARSYASVALGMYNDSIATSNISNRVATDPLLIVGNGTGTAVGARSNALMILKNGNTGIGFNLPTNKLEVNGVTRTLGIRVDGAANNGTLLKHVQANTAVLGTGIAGVNIYTINFPVAFATTPKVNCTPRSPTAVGDMYVTTIRSVTTAGFTVLVYRIDPGNAGVGWGQALQLDWMAWEQ